MGPVLETLPTSSRGTESTILPLRSFDTYLPPALPRDESYTLVVHRNDTSHRMNLPLPCGRKINLPPSNLLRSRFFACAAALLVLPRRRHTFSCRCHRIFRSIDSNVCDALFGSTGMAVLFAAIFQRRGLPLLACESLDNLTL